MYQNVILPDSAYSNVSNASSFKTSASKISIRKLLMVLLISLAVISCVTINIYFPAAAAEKAAEKIVDEVLQSGDVVPGDAAPDGLEGEEINTNDAQSFHIYKPQFYQEQFYQEQIYQEQIYQEQIYQEQWSAGDYILSSVVDILIPSAHAGQANISIDSPKIRSIRNSMEKRQSKLEPFYKSGAAGFTNDGLIATVKLSGLSVKKQSTLKKLISAENKDRKALYREIARANGHPEWQKDIQKTFARTWINKISKGWMYQTPQGKWVKK